MCSRPTASGAVAKAVAKRINNTREDLDLQHLLRKGLLVRKRDGGRPRKHDSRCRTTYLELAITL